MAVGGGPEGQFSVGMVVDGVSVGIYANHDDVGTASGVGGSSGAMEALAVVDDSGCAGVWLAAGGSAGDSLDIDGKHARGGVGAAVGSVTDTTVKVSENTCAAVEVLDAHGVVDVRTTVELVLVHIRVTQGAVVEVGARELRYSVGSCSNRRVVATGIGFHNSMYGWEEVPADPPVGDCAGNEIVEWGGDVTVKEVGIVGDCVRVEAVGGVDACADGEMMALRGVLGKRVGV